MGTLWPTNSNMQATISKGEDETKVKGEIKALLENGWTLDEENIKISKTYHLKTYTKVLDLHNFIGVGSKAKNHHATMTSDFGKLIGTVEPKDAQKCGPTPSAQI